MRKIHEGSYPHRTLTPDAMNIIEVSFRMDDNIFKDAPATFDRVLEITGQEKLHLLGFSKGTTVALGLLANKVEYNKKVRILILISPVTTIYDPNPLLGFLMEFLKVCVYVVS